jgi:hypothetical protein
VPTYTTKYFFLEYSSKPVPKLSLGTGLGAELRLAYKANLCKYMDSQVQLGNQEPTQLGNQKSRVRLTHHFSAPKTRPTDPEKRADTQVRPYVYFFFEYSLFSANPMTLRMIWLVPS